MNHSEFSHLFDKLTPDQKPILRHFLQGLSDEQVADLLHCSQANVRKHLSNICRLFQLNTEGTRGYSHRYDLIELFSEHKPDLVSSHLQTGKPRQEISLESPEGPVPLDSPFYVERHPLETDCHEQIERNGALIRIKTPRQMGKSSVMLRILSHARKRGCVTARLNLQLVDTEFLDNLDRFLEWFCATVTQELDLPERVSEYWEGVVGSKRKCTNYFQRYLLPESNRPIVIGLDDVDCLFPYREIATDFFGLLRAWHEKAKEEVSWKKFRLVIAHSKEVYIPLSVNQSPFNVGFPVELPMLHTTQIHELVQKHGLIWSAEQVRQLEEIVGGHPYLVRVALYELARGRMTLEELKSVGPTEAGPYEGHLRRHLLNIEADSKLLQALKQVVATQGPVTIGSTESFKLRGLGLVQFKKNQNQVAFTCDLYRQYFCDRLGMSV